MPCSSSRAALPDTIKSEPRLSAPPLPLVLREVTPPLLPRLLMAATPRGAGAEWHLLRLDDARWREVVNAWLKMGVGTVAWVCTELQSRSVTLERSWITHDSLLRAALRACSCCLTLRSCDSRDIFSVSSWEVSAASSLSAQSVSCSEIMNRNMSVTQSLPVCTRARKKAG